MNVLIVGAGGREHALAWKIIQSPKCSRLFVAPGNAGTGSIAQNVQLSPTDFAGLGKFCLQNSIELVIVGPEEPLVKGIVDHFKNDASLSSIKVFGPDKDASRLEGSKDYSKRFMMEHGIPTASAMAFDRNSLDQGLAYIDSHLLPVVLKADGLAAGKGVIICDTVAEAKEVLTSMLAGNKFGEAGSTVLVEEYLDGIELSVFVLTDGKEYLILPEAKDYKRIGEGDTGLNTGGMGAVSPVPFAGPAFMSQVEDTIIKPTLRGLQSEKMNYLGFIFFGLIKVNGQPKVIEYNIRLGDPEAEAVLPRTRSDLLEHILSCFDHTLKDQQVEMDPRSSSTVMLVSAGYPEAYEKGKVIRHLDMKTEALIFHAGTSTNPAGETVTNGGRVISVTGMGNSLPEALRQSFDGAKTIQWEGMNYRRDIGQDVL